LLIHKENRCPITIQNITRFLHDHLERLSAFDLEMDIDDGIDYFLEFICEQEEEIGGFQCMCKTIIEPTEITLGEIEDSFFEDTIITNK